MGINSGNRKNSNIKIVRGTNTGTATPQSTQPEAVPISQLELNGGFSLVTLDDMASDRSNPLLPLKTMPVLTIMGGRLDEPMVRGIVRIKQHGQLVPGTDGKQWEYSQQYVWQGSTYTLKASYDASNLPTKTVEVRLIRDGLSSTQELSAIRATNLGNDGIWDFVAHTPNDLKATAYPTRILGYLTWLISQPGKPL